MKQRVVELVQRGVALRKRYARDHDALSVAQRERIQAPPELTIVLND
jgi:hypothetical protein